MLVNALLALVLHCLGQKKASAARLTALVPARNAWNGRAVMVSFKGAHAVGIGWRSQGNQAKEQKLKTGRSTAQAS